MNHLFVQITHDLNLPFDDCINGTMVLYIFNSQSIECGNIIRVKICIAHEDDRRIAVIL